MPERLRVEALRVASIGEVNDFLSGLDGAQKLPSLPTQFASRFAHAWRVPVNFDDARRNLLVMLDKDFPFSLPRIAVDAGAELLKWPHLERDGLLCVVPNLTSSNYREPRAVTCNLLAVACALIEHNVRENTNEELRDEFLSYWSYACDKDSLACVSIVSPNGPARQIAVWKSASQWYFADDEVSLKHWLSNRFPSGERASFAVTKGWLIWRSKPWLPIEYPANPADLLALLIASKKDISLADIGRVANGGLAVLVGACTTSGACFAALAHSAPGKKKYGPKGRSIDPKIKGFRPGQVPPHLQLKRALGSGARMNRCQVERADAAWVHGRDQDPVSTFLRQKRVAVVGIGSLGSEIATLLAQSGVGTLRLIDGELMEWANISRHRLGAESVGLSKAKALSKMLRNRFPHINVNALRAAIGLQSKEVMGEILSADLVVSVTGTWSAASLLNALWLDEDQPPDMIVAWMEAHALAAHSVHFSKDQLGGCLQCQMTATGRPLLSAIAWEADPTLQVPACGGAFMPYGPIGVASAAALSAEHCIDVLCDQSRGENHRVWVGKQVHLERAGGKWSQDWVSAMGEPGSGGFQATSSWTRNKNCIACGVVPL